MVPVGQIGTLDPAYKTVLGKAISDKGASNRTLEITSESKSHLECPKARSPGWPPARERQLRSLLFTPLFPQRHADSLLSKIIIGTSLSTHRPGGKNKLLDAAGFKLTQSFWESRVLSVGGDEALRRGSAQCHGGGYFDYSCYYDHLCPQLQPSWGAPEPAG